MKEHQQEEGTDRLRLRLKVIHAQNLSRSWY